MKFEVRVNGYDLIVNKNGEKLFVTQIKTTRQRKYRWLDDFYKEVMNIKENQIDRMLRLYGRQNIDIEKEFEKQESMLKELGVNKEEVIDSYRENMIDYVSNYEYR